MSAERAWDALQNQLAVVGDSKFLKSLDWTDEWKHTLGWFAKIDMRGV